MTYKNLPSLSPAKIVFSIVLSIAAVYLFYEGTLFGIVLLGAALRLSYIEGIELDLEKMRYRKLHSILAFDFGKWRPLPAIEYVSVFKTQKTSRARVITAEAHMGFEVYKVNLFYASNKHIEAYVSDDSNAAFAMAKDMAAILKIKIWDATQTEQRWR
ncbi:MULTISPECIES: hypothetical protein [Altibacter]|uniref:hypothetical protein n=1 Tax=Altibacter TaxID=1535231 RepID=UPI0012689646|nr:MULTISPECIES: hypothetical protein [Altibacter]MCW9036971.1 hypothetical protein [Altibacter sp.]